jgi:hypothetical protein
MRLSSAPTAAASLVPLMAGSEAGRWPGSIGRATDGSDTACGAVGAGSNVTPWLVLAATGWSCKWSAGSMTGIAASRQNTATAATASGHARLVLARGLSVVCLLDTWVS